MRTIYPEMPTTLLELDKYLKDRGLDAQVSSVSFESDQRRYLIIRKSD